MRVQLRGVDYRIRFEFSQTRRRQTTKAIIEARVTHPDRQAIWEPIMTGESHCHPVDVKVYDRTRGKRIALDRCFLETILPNGDKSYHTPKEDRSVFWEAFNKAHPKKAKKEKKMTPSVPPGDMSLEEAVQTLAALGTSEAFLLEDGRRIDPGEDDVF